MNKKRFVNILLIIIIAALIGVAGYFALVKKSPTINPDWETYTNTKHNYKISYPGDTWTTENLFDPNKTIDPDFISLFHIESSKKSIECRCGGGRSVIIRAYPNNEKLSPEEFLKQNFSFWFGASASYDDYYYFIDEPATFNGISARKFGTERDEYFLFVKETTAFTVTAQGYDGIIETFRLTN